MQLEQLAERPRVPFVLAVVPDRADIDTDEVGGVKLVREKAQHVAPRAAEVEDDLPVDDRVIAGVEVLPQAPRLLVAPRDRGLVLGLREGPALEGRVGHAAASRWRR